MAQTDIVSRITEIAGPLAASLGLELVEIEYKREGRAMVLRVYVDREGGVTLDDCTKVSRELSEKQKLFERGRQDAQADFQEDRQDVMNRIGTKMVQIISDYAKQNGYALILDAQIPIVGSNDVSDAQIPIYYASQDVDVRDEIVKRYDAAFPSEAAATPAPSAAKPASSTAAKPAVKPPAKPPAKPQP